MGPLGDKDLKKGDQMEIRISKRRGFARSIPTYLNIGSTPPGIQDPNDAASITEGFVASQKLTLVEHHTIGCVRPGC